MSVAIAIMAGGESRRMGADKALLRFGGEPMLQRTARLAAGTGREVVVAGREAPPGWALSDVLFIPDERRGEGPLGGLVAALRHLGRPVLLVPCDLPLLGTDALLWLLGRAEEGPLRDGLLTLNGGRPEPLFSVYAPSVLPHAVRLLREGRRSMQELHRAGSFRMMELPEEIRPLLRNVNTPQDWEEVKGLAEPGGPGSSLPP